MTTSTVAPVPTTLPDVWGPAMRTVLSPRMGHFSIHATLAGPEKGMFEAFPLDPVLVGHRFGLIGFYAEDVATLVERIREW